MYWNLFASPMLTIFAHVWCPYGGDSGHTLDDASSIYAVKLPIFPTTTLDEFIANNWMVQISMWIMLPLDNERRLAELWTGGCFSSVKEPTRCWGIWATNQTVTDNSTKNKRWSTTRKIWHRFISARKTTATGHTKFTMVNQEEDAIMTANVASRSIS